MNHDSEGAYALGLSVVQRDPRLLFGGPVRVPLESLDDLREVAYLALSLQGLDPEDSTLRICRWLRRQQEKHAMST